MDKNPLQQLRVLQLAESSMGYFPLFLLAVAIGGCFYAGCSNIQRRAQISREANDNERRRAAAAATLESTTLPNTRATNDTLVDGMSRSDREAYVKNFLKTCVMTKDRLQQMTMAQVDEEEMQVEGGSMLSVDGATGSLVSSIREDSGFWSVGGVASQRLPHCAICLERLKVGEDVGLSQNVKCPHVFHKVCITEWLMANKECPVCRRKYLDLEP